MRTLRELCEISRKKTVLCTNYVLNCILYNQHLKNINEINVLCEEGKYNQFCFKRMKALEELTRFS